MTAYDYAPLAQTAARLIERFGMAVTWRAVVSASGGTAWDPAEQTTLDWELKAVFLQPARADRTTIAQRDDEQRKGHLRAYVDAGGRELSAKDSVIAKGREYRVISATRLEPATVNLLWEVELET